MIEIEIMKIAAVFIRYEFMHRVLYCKYRYILKHRQIILMNWQHYYKHR